MAGYFKRILNDLKYYDPDMKQLFSFCIRQDDFDKFKIFFKSFKLKNNEDFNLILLDCIKMDRINFLEYMIVHKGDFIIDPDILIDPDRLSQS